MAEPLTALLAFGLGVLAAVLGSLAVLAARRFEERRFLAVAVGFALISVVGFLAFVSELYNLLDEQFAVEPAPLALLVVSVGLLFYAMVPRTEARGVVGHG